MIMRFYVNSIESINISLNMQNFGLSILMAYRMLEKITRAHITEQVIYVMFESLFCTVDKVIGVFVS